MSLKNKYEPFQKKYFLPNFEEISKDFNLDEIEHESDQILPRIREKMVEKIEFNMKIAESILQPDNSLVSMYEAHYISENEKKEAYSLFKSLMQLIRENNLVSINNSEEKNAEYIKKCFSQWVELKQDLENQIARLIEIWKKETDIGHDLSYFG